MSANTLSSLKVTARPKIEKSPTITKRMKLIDRLDEQLEMVKCMLENKPFERYRNKTVTNKETGQKEQIRVRKMVRPWYYDIRGHYYFELKVGTTAIELQKGKPAIDVGDKDNLPEVIEQVTRAVEAGELDTHIEETSKKNKPPKA